jgi:alpha-N-arabinofuranosidase
MALDALPDLDIVAGTNDDGSIVTVLIVNRSLEAVRAVLDLKAFEASGETTLYEITGDSYDDINSVFQPDRIMCKESRVPSEAWRQGYDLRPSSVYALEFRAQV